MQTDRLIPLIFRDALLIGVTLALWRLVLAHPRATGLGAIALHAAAGLMSAVSGYLIHEWGHLFGCWAWRSVVVLPERVTAVFLFNFDVGRNDRRQFNAMAMGGFIASLLYVALLFALAPWDLLAGKIALTLTTLGVIATFVFEVPTAWRVWRGSPIPQQGPAFVSGSGS